MRDRLLPALLQKGDEVVAYALQCGDAGWLSRRKRRASLLDSANSFNGLLYDEIVPVASGLYRKNPYFREFHRRREGLDVREI